MDSSANSTRKGQYVSGKMSGVGYLRSPSSETLGQMLEFVLSGVGRESRGLERYEGDWLRGQREGYGHWGDGLGNRYSGGWKDGKRESIGKEIKITPTKEEYLGQFVSNHREGFGILSLPTGEYRGNFKAGIQSGLGYHQNTQGGWYLGDWKDGYRQGRGIQASPGGLYKGYWKDDLPEGEGVLYPPDRPSLAGIFQRGKLVKTLPVTQVEARLGDLATLSREEYMMKAASLKEKFQGWIRGEGERVERILAQILQIYTNNDSLLKKKLDALEDEMKLADRQLKTTSKMALPSQLPPLTITYQQVAPTPSKISTDREPSPIKASTTSKKTSKSPFSRKLPATSKSPKPAIINTTIQQKPKETTIPATSKSPIIKHEQLYPNPLTKPLPSGLANTSFTTRPTPAQPSFPHPAQGIIRATPTTTNPTTTTPLPTPIPIPVLPSAKNRVVIERDIDDSVTREPMKMEADVHFCERFPHLEDRVIEDKTISRDSVRPEQVISRSSIAEDRREPTSVSSIRMNTEAQNIKDGALSHKENNVISQNITKDRYSGYSSQHDQRQPDQHPNPTSIIADPMISASNNRGDKMTPTTPPLSTGFIPAPQAVNGENKDKNQYADNRDKNSDIDKGRNTKKMSGDNVDGHNVQTKEDRNGYSSNRGEKPVENNPVQPSLTNAQQPPHSNASTPTDPPSRPPQSIPTPSIVSAGGEKRSSIYSVSERASPPHPAHMEKRVSFAPRIETIHLIPSAHDTDDDNGQRSEDSKVDEKVRPSGYYLEKIEENSVLKVEKPKVENQIVTPSDVKPSEITQKPVVTIPSNTVEHPPKSPPHSQPAEDTTPPQAESSPPLPISPSPQTLGVSPPLLPLSVHVPDDGNYSIDTTKSHPLLPALFRVEPILSNRFVLTEYAHRGDNSGDRVLRKGDTKDSLSVSGKTTARTTSVGKDSVLSEFDKKSPPSAKIHVELPQVEEEVQVASETITPNRHTQTGGSIAVNLEEQPAPIDSQKQPSNSVIVQDSIKINQPKKEEKNDHQPEKKAPNLELAPIDIVPPSQATIETKQFSPQAQLHKIIPGYSTISNIYHITQVKAKSIHPVQSKPKQEQPQLPLMKTVEHSSLSSTTDTARHYKLYDKATPTLPAHQELHHDKSSLSVAPPPPASISPSSHSMHGERTAGRIEILLDRVVSPPLLLAVIHERGTLVKEKDAVLPSHWEMLRHDDQCRYIVPKEIDVPSSRMMQAEWDRCTFVRPKEAVLPSSHSMNMMRDQYILLKPGEVVRPSNCVLDSRRDVFTYIKPKEMVLPSSNVMMSLTDHVKYIRPRDPIPPSSNVMISQTDHFKYIQPREPITPSSNVMISQTDHFKYIRPREPIPPSFHLLTSSIDQFKYIHPKDTILPSSHHLSADRDHYTYIRPKDSILPSNHILSAHTDKYTYTRPIDILPPSSQTLDAQSEQHTLTKPREKVGIVPPDSPLPVINIVADPSPAVQEEQKVEGETAGRLGVAGLEVQAGGNALAPKNAANPRKSLFQKLTQHSMQDHAVLMTSLAVAANEAEKNRAAAKQDSDDSMDEKDAQKLQENMKYSQIQNDPSSVKMPDTFDELLKEPSELDSPTRSEAGLFNSNNRDSMGVVWPTPTPANVQSSNVSEAGQDDKQGMMDLRGRMTSKTGIPVIKDIHANPISGPVPESKDGASNPIIVEEKYKRSATDIKELMQKHQNASFDELPTEPQLRQEISEMESPTLPASALKKNKDKKAEIEVNQVDNTELSISQISRTSEDIKEIKERNDTLAKKVFVESEKPKKLFPLSIICLIQIK